MASKGPLVILTVLAAIAVFCNLASSLENVGVNLKTLRLVQVVFRHGDRSPLHKYPNDPYKPDEIWPEGFGQLTGKGKDQHYELGKYFRKRYDGFLDQMYNRRHIHVLSSDTDRTLMSAEANLAGLFPAVKNASMVILKAAPASVMHANVHDHVNIQLVPIHTMNQEYDPLLKQTAPCPRRDQARDEYFNSEAYRKVARQHQKFVDFIKEKAGFKTFSMDDMVDVHDPLFCQKQHGLRLPAWATDKVMHDMEKIRGLNFALASPTVEVRRLFGGPLVKRLMDNMAQVVNGSMKLPRKAFVHSAHDDTVSSLLMSLGVFDPQIPPYASAVITELHQDPSNSEYHVKIFFKNETNREPYRLHVPRCGSPCRLSKLEKLLEPVIPVDYARECQADFRVVRSSQEPSLMSMDGLNRPGLPMLTLFLIIVIVTSCFWIAVLCYISRKYEKGIYIKFVAGSGSNNGNKQKEYDPL